MRLPRRKFHATVQVQTGVAPVVIGLGPGLTLEATIDETVQLATELNDAIEQARRGGAGGC